MKQCQGLVYEVLKIMQDRAREERAFHVSSVAYEAMDPDARTFDTDPYNRAVELRLLVESLVLRG
jgi:hypothetical protein